MMYTLTANQINSAKKRFTPQEPLDKDLLKKIEELVPKTKWPTGLHKDIASKLGITNKKVTTYITALKHQGRIANPI